MPIFSYLAYPVPGARDELLAELSNIAFCEVTPAENADVLILVTDTPDADTEQRLQAQLRSLSSLKSLGMAFGHTDT